MQTATVHERLLDGTTSHCTADMRLWRGGRWIPSRELLIRSDRGELTLTNNNWTIYGAAAEQRLAIGLHSITRPNAYRDGTIIAIINITAANQVTIRSVNVMITNGIAADETVLHECIALIGYSADGTFAVHLRDFTVPELIDEDMWRFRVDRPQSEIPSLWSPQVRRNHFQRLRQRELIQHRRTVDEATRASTSAQTEPPAIVDTATQYTAPPSPTLVEPSIEQQALKSEIEGESPAVRTTTDEERATAHNIHCPHRRSAVPLNSEPILPSAAVQQELQPLFDHMITEEEFYFPDNARFASRNFGIRRKPKNKPEPPVDLTKRWDKDRLQ